MAVADRFQSWLEGLGRLWAAPLKGFISGAIDIGLEAFEDRLGKKLSGQLKPLLDKLDTAGVITPELAPLLEELRKPTGETAYGLANTLSANMLGSTVGMMMDYLLRPIREQASKLPGFWLPEPALLTA